MPFDDDELVTRFNRRLAGIESEIPNPPDPYSRGAGSMTQVGQRGSRLGWVPPFVVAISLLALAVIGLRSLPGPDPAPSAPAVGRTSPSPGLQASPPVESLAPTTLRSPEPSAPSTPKGGPPVTPSPAPTSSLTPSPSAPLPSSTPPSNRWIGPERIATEHYVEVTLVVGAAGDAHIAASAGEGIGEGIFYLTNASGSWTREQLTSAPRAGFDGEPEIVIRDDGSLAIVFTRFAGLQCTFGCVPVDPQGIFLVSNRSGSWSDAVRIIEGRVQEPSLQAGGGLLHLAYSRGAVVDGGLEYGDEERTVEYAYAADETGTWTIQTVGEGSAPSLRLGRDGSARIAYDQRFRPGRGNLYYAAQADSGEFVMERLGGDWLVSTPLLALDGNDEPQIVFFSDTPGEPPCGALLVQRAAGVWSDASVVFPEDELCHLVPGAVATDSDGTLHVISSYNLTSLGVWYANDAGGEFQARQLRGLGGRSTSDVPYGDSAIGVDAGGRPHVLYVVLSSGRRDDDGLWYGIGPSVER